MKQGLPWLIGGIAIGVIAFFLINMTIPSSVSTQRFNTSVAECGETLNWNYCSKGQMCTTQCNTCSCRQPSCHPDDFCSTSESDTLPSGTIPSSEPTTAPTTPPPPNF